MRQTTIKSKQGDKFHGKTFVDERGNLFISSSYGIHKKAIFVKDKEKKHGN